MTRLFKGAALAVVMSALSSTCWADTSTDVKGLKAEIDGAVKLCDAKGEAFKCAWKDNVLQDALHTCKADPKDFECEALDVKDHLPYPQSAIDEEVTDYKEEARELADALYADLKDFEGPQKRFKTFAVLKYNVETSLKILKASCKADAEELQHKLNPVFEIYKAFGGKNCKGII